MYGMTWFSLELFVYTLTIQKNELYQSDYIFNCIIFQWKLIFQQILFKFAPINQIEDKWFRW